MEEQGNTPESQDLKKDRSHVSEAGAPNMAGLETQPQTNGSAANGSNGVLPNGISHGDERNGNNSTLTDSGSPPPLDQSWRETSHNVSLGKLLIRTAEDCWAELNTTLMEMAAEPLPPQGNGANGITPTEDTDAVSVRKKTQLMKFAQGQRDRFVRALVISDWAKDADAFARIIDVNSHLGKMNASHLAATTAIGEMKLAMNQAKMPNPNIEGALEILATGKSYGLPDFGYITPPKMSAKELLRTLRDMNVTLATRLTLHEELPEYFNEYTIADGRATFTVPGEFEVDLAVADEDPTSPFFFIELRFLFTPAPTQLADQIQNFCEVAVNTAIAAKGLGGCYDVLHNFVLTHKLNILHSQQPEVLAGKWFESIRLERMRRSVIISYWIGRSGRKSWIELGIGSGKAELRGFRQKPTPVISVRWFQRGIEAHEAKLEIDWQCVSLESVLLQAIARHTSTILSHVESDLKTLVSGDSSFSTEARTSDSEPNDCELIMKHPSLRQPVRYFIEPVTGKIAITPSTPATRRTSNVLNTEPNAETARQLASMLCACSLEHVDKQAATLAWRSIKDIAPPKNPRALFGEDPGMWKIFLPSERWGATWAIAITASLEGCKWWVVQLQEADPSKPRAIINARRIREHIKAESVPSRRLLLQIEKAALAEVSYTALSMQLNHMRIPHHFENPSLNEGDNGNRQRSASAMFINFSKLMNISRDRNWRPWAQELVRLTHHGDDTSLAGRSDVLFTRHDLRLALHSGSFKQLRRHFAHSKSDRDIAMNDTGGLAIRFRTPFGAPFAEQIRTKLSFIKRLDHYLTVLKECHATCNVASLSRLVFTYSSNPDLSAHLTFSNDGKQPMKLRLEPPEGNPHLRIRTLLEQGFNSNSENAFSDTVHILYLSLPVLRAFEELQAGHSARQSLTLHVRSASWYSFKYKAPLLQITFQIRTRTKLEGNKRLVRWHVQQDPNKTNAESLPADLLKALGELWQRNDEHCIGLTNGLMADAQGIGPALLEIDEIVRRFDAPVAPATEDLPERQAKPAVQPQEVIALD